MLTMTLTFADAMVLTGPQGLRIVIHAENKGGKPSVSVDAPPDIKIHREPRQYHAKRRQTT